MNKETTRKPGKKTGFFQSMRFRLLLCVLLSAVIVGGIMMAIVIPASISTMKSVTKNYIYDLTNLTGQELQQAVDAAGFEIAKQELPQIAGAVSIRDVESSYCYIMDNNGTLLYHPQTDKIGQTVDNTHIEDVIKKLQAGSKPSTEVISYVDNGVQEYSACYINPTSEFIVVITADEAEIISPVNSMISKTIAGAVLALIICLLVATIVISILLRPLSKINQEVARFATMDFTNSDDMGHLSKHKDEIGSMGRALNELRQKLVSAVQVLQDQSKKLYRASKQLQAESMEAANVIDQVDSAVHDIADGATSQANETQSATENVLIIGSMIEQSNSNIQEIRGNSEQINESATVAADTLGQLTQINTQVKKAIDAIYQQTHTTNDSATKIKEAATLITTIAEETNLLSLNASIEAARAGEHGKGFAVVANQIQKLAEQSNESANQIEGIISELIVDSDRTVATMEEVREVVEQQDLSVKKTDEIFRTVQKGINNSIDAIEKVSSDTAEMDRARINITDTVQNLTAIAEENAASTQETSASATQVRTAVDTISESASSLNEIALELEETMSQFKI